MVIYLAQEISGRVVAVDWAVEKDKFEAVKKTSHQSHADVEEQKTDEEDLEEDESDEKNELKGNKDVDVRAGDKTLGIEEEGLLEKAMQQNVLGELLKKVSKHL